MSEAEPDLADAGETGAGEGGRGGPRAPELPHLGPLEQDVMNVLWVSCEVNDEPLPIRAVSNHIPDLAYTTVATVLSNLKRKGMVEQLRDQPVLRYRPLRGRARHAAWMMTQILDGAQNRQRCLEKFVAELDPADVEILRDLLRQHAVEQTRT